MISAVASVERVLSGQRPMVIPEKHPDNDTQPGG